MAQIRWTKELVVSELKIVKAKEGKIHRSYLRKNHNKLRGAFNKELINRKSYT